MYVYVCIQKLLFTELFRSIIVFWASHVVLVVKNPPANAGDVRDVGSVPGMGRFPWSGAWQPSPVLLPGESHGQRSLVGCSPWCCRAGYYYASTCTHILPLLCILSLNF